jgi:3-phenylpropionate/trans-cinnamate dioxygenase ferredoxin reductase subunit
VLKQRFSAARNVVVIGAGFIGLEFAAVAKAAGATVHVLELAERPMARALSVAMSQAFAAALTQWGLQFHFNQRVTRIVGKDGRVTGVETAQGEHYPADLVVYGIGAVPNVEIAAVAGLTCKDGVVVDDHLLTSDPHISAIGDCVRFPAGGEMLRPESVQNAVDQARNVAARLMGKNVPHHTVPRFWSDQAHLKLQMAGLMTGHDGCVTIGSVPELAWPSRCCVSSRANSSPLNRSTAQATMSRRAGC